MPQQRPQKQLTIFKKGLFVNCNCRNVATKVDCSGKRLSCDNFYPRCHLVQRGSTICFVVVFPEQYTLAAKHEEAPFCIVKK
jgi:hypothetical protein